MSNTRELTQTEKNEIISRLAERGVNTQCPMCTNKDFVLLKGLMNHPLQADFKNIQIGGKILPTTAIVCKKCGFISQHALSVLGLLDTPAEAKN